MVPPQQAGKDAPAPGGTAAASGPIRVGSLVIHADEVTIVRAGGKEAPAPSPRRYRINAALLALAMVLLTIWFSVHLETFVTRTVVVGSLSLYAIWKVIESWLRKDFLGPTEDARKKVLARSETTEFLVFGLLLVAFLIATTSSIYLELDGRAAEPATVRFVEPDGSEYARLTASPAARLVGGPRYLRTKARQLSVQVVDPAGYEAQTITLRPWGRVFLTFPNAFEQRRYRLVQLVPGFALAGAIPAKGEEARDRWTLTVIRSDGRAATLTDFRKQTVWIGAAETDLERLVPRLHDEKYEGAVERYFIDHGVPDEARSSLISQWMTFEPTFLATPELSEGEEIHIVVADGDKPPIVDMRRPVTGAVTTLFLNPESP